MSGTSNVSHPWPPDSEILHNFALKPDLALGFFFFFELARSGCGILALVFTPPPPPPVSLRKERYRRASRSDHVQEFSPEHVKEHAPGLTFPNNLATYLTHNLLSDEQSNHTAVSTSTSTQEHSPASPPAPPDIPLSHIREFSIDDQHNINATSMPSSSTEEHVPTSQFSPLSIPTPPDKLHRTLSSWIKNMNRLFSLIDRLQELASSAPPEHQSQLSNQVVALCATSQKQKQHFMEFLQLSEEYANKYLLDISAEIQQQSSFLDKLKERIEAAEKLRGDAIDLQKFYESGTVSVMKDFRTTGKPVLCHLQKQNIKSFIFSIFAAASRGLCLVQRGGQVADRD